MAKWDLSKLPEGRKPLDDAWFKERAQMQERIKKLEVKLAKAVWLLVDATVQLEKGKIKTRRNHAALIRQFLAELTGGNDE